MEIRATTGATQLRFRERARVGRAFLRRLEPFARPAFVANHAWMMYRCRVGLVAALAGCATAIEMLGAADAGGIERR
jgi:hypothetical protein